MWQAISRHKLEVLDFSCIGQQRLYHTWYMSSIDVSQYEVVRGGGDEDLKGLGKQCRGKD